MASFLKYIREPLSLSLFNFGGADITLGSLLGILVAFLTLLVLTSWLRRWLAQRLLVRSRLDPGTRETVASLTRYIVLAIGVLVIIDGTGIKLSSFTILAGAFGVGVGFGLQNIFSNLISGLIVMFERPVKIGDHVVISGAEGDVIDIGMRGTSLKTAQGSLVIVPNQSLITGNVVNWDQDGNSVMIIQLRMMGKVNEDTELLLKILQANLNILQAPFPSVFVTAIDHSGHTMEVHFWLSGNAEHRLKVLSDVNIAILKELERLGQALAP